jgi:hypothetical protein
MFRFRVRSRLPCGKPKKVGTVLSFGEALLHGAIVAAEAM